MRRGFFRLNPPCIMNKKIKRFIERKSKKIILIFCNEREFEGTKLVKDEIVTRNDS